MAMMMTHGHDQAEIEAQKATIWQMVGLASKYYLKAPTLHSQMAAMHMANPSQYGVCEWVSIAGFQKDFKAVQKQPWTMIPMRFRPYGCVHPEDPCSWVKLPPPSRKRFLTVFRIMLAAATPSSAPVFSDVYTLVPMQLDFPPELSPGPGFISNASEAEASLLSMLKADVGLKRKRLGKCSACEATQHISNCAGCSCHAYCSKECQRSLWSEHKQLCKLVKSFGKGKLAESGLLANVI